jgi:putative sterol carrier protein
MADERMSTEEFREMIKGKSDEEILAGAKGNEEPLLEGIFDGMKDAFEPSKATGQTAVIQYNIDTPNGVMSYHLNVDNGTCSIEKGAASEPRVGFAIDLPNFLRLVIGELDGMKAYMSGQLKITGDLMFSQNIPRWFKQPGS